MCFLLGLKPATVILKVILHIAMLYSKMFSKLVIDLLKNPLFGSIQTKEIIED